MEREEEEGEGEVKGRRGGKEAGEEASEETEEEEDDEKVKMNAIFRGMLLVVSGRERKKAKEAQNKKRKGIIKDVVDGLLCKAFFFGFFVIIITLPFVVVIGRRITATKEKSSFENIRTHSQIHQRKAKCFPFHKISRINMKINSQNRQNGNHYHPHIGPCEKKGAKRRGRRGRRGRGRGGGRIDEKEEDAEEGKKKEEEERNIAPNGEA